MFGIGHSMGGMHNLGIKQTPGVHSMHLPSGMGGKMGMRLDAGGGVDPTQTGIGGLTPSTQSMNPMTQGMYQRYAQLPTEKLQELNAQMGGTPYGAVIRAVLQRRLSQPTQQQTIPQQQQQLATLPASGMQPVQQQQARGGATHRAAGGMAISPSMGDPWWTRQESYGADHSGFLAGTTAGRADQIKTTAPGGAYVLPADVLSGLGEGNSLAGARVMDAILGSGPHGTEQPRMREGRGPPRPPTDPQLAQASGVAKGGGVQQGSGAVPVALSHGEYVIDPARVAALGGGNLRRGHRILDAFTLAVRNKTIAKLRSLPGPVGAKKN